jgi:hypothetical protein
MRVRNWVGLALGGLVVGMSLACGAGGTCTVGATECDGDTLKACGADGNWYETPCPDGTSCGDVSGVMTCKPDDIPVDGGGDAGGGEGGEGEGGGEEGGGDEGGGKAKGGKRKAGR